MHDDIPRKIDEAAAALTKLGCAVADFPGSKFPELFEKLNVFQMWSLLLHEGKDENFKAVIRDQTSPFRSIVHLLWETILSVAEYSDHTLPALLLALCEYTVEWTPEYNNTLRKLAARIRRDLEELLRGDVVWILPSLPTPAPLHNESILRIFDVSNTGFFNVMELPVTAVPVGLTSDRGVPIGLQVVSGRGQDHLCIAVAHALQANGIAKWSPPREYA